MLKSILLYFDVKTFSRTEDTAAQKRTIGRPPLTPPCRVHLSQLRGLARASVRNWQALTPSNSTKEETLQ